MLSHTAEYALRAVLYIAQHEERGVIHADEIATALRVPRKYLAKTLNQLVHQGVLESLRGRAGGFRLGRRAEELRLLDVVECFDVDQGRRMCLLGRSKCSDSNPCPAHSRWKSISESNATFFRETTVGDLIRVTDVSVQ